MESHKHFLQLLSVLIMVAALMLFMAPEEMKVEGMYAVKSAELVPKTVKLVEVEVDGEILKIITKKDLVKEVLAETKIILGDADKTEPELEKTFDNQIKVIRVTKKQVEKKKYLAFPTEEKKSADLFKGETRILQKGERGIEKDIYEVITENGQEVARNFIRKVLVKEPIKQVVALGTRQSAYRDGSSLDFKEVHTMTATAYTHTGNRTATGIWPKVGIVAVDPRVIPLGTRLYVDGYGYATAADVGGAIKGKRIDVFMETKAESRQWGRRQVQVFVLH